MEGFLERPEAQVVLWGSGCAALFAIGIYVVSRVRDSLGRTDATSQELLAKFGELHAQGELSDDEFRTIKTTLAARLPQEIKDSDEEV